MLTLSLFHSSVNRGGDINPDNSKKTGMSNQEDNRETASRDQTKLTEAPWIIIKGFFMGSADVVPGVSGGTMALILGVYSRLINAIKSVNARAIKYAARLRLRELFGEVHWLFLFFLATGMALAVVFFTRVVPLHELMYTHPERIYGLFFGLITGSVFLLAYSLNAWRWKPILAMIAGTAFGFRIVTLVPTDTPENALFVFASGAVAITAMVLPGISGSFILLILQKYDYILGNISLLGTSETMTAVIVLIPFGLGMITGIVLFTRLLSWMLKHYYVATLSVLIGFMVGSLYVIWPFQDREFTESVRTEKVDVNDEIVGKIEDGYQPDDPLERKELGEIVNPNAPEPERQIEVKTISMKMIGSEPFWPSWKKADEDERLSDGTNAIRTGLLFMFGGFLLVGFLGYISNWKIV